MDWATLWPVVIGGALATAGGLVGQWVGGRQARGREARDRDQERDVWARSLRYDAHVQFLKTHDELFKTAQRTKGYRQHSLADGPTIASLLNLPPEFMVPLWDRLAVVRLVSEPTTTTTAQWAVGALQDHLYSNMPVHEVNRMLDKYIEAIRQEFNLGPIQRLWGDPPSPS